MPGTELNPSARAELMQTRDPVLSTAEVAMATGLSQHTLRRWASAQPDGALLPHTKRAGRNWYRASDVRRWLRLEDPAPTAA